MNNQSTNASGVRYLTEDFIKVTTKEERLDKVKKLNLSGSKNENPIKYIENLDSLTSLNVLILNFNIVEKIEKLEKLVNLKELHLNGNKISKLDGIECLIKLKVLDVGNNTISSIPHWLTRRCKYLKIIDISNNEFDSMEELSKLYSLKDLSELNVAENPVTSVSHYRSCVIMRLKYLEILDKKKISIEERKEAVERFDQDDIDKLTTKLVEKEKEFEQMKEKQEKLEEEHSHHANYQKDLNKKQKDYIGKIKTLEEELKNKDAMLKKKSEDLFKTCQKYYELEQDLAFIKIDAKFDILNQNLGSLDAPDDVSEHSITGTGDHAYMGKGQFITPKEAQMLQQRLKARQQGDMTNGASANGGRNSTTYIKEQLLNSLDERIREKMIKLDEVNRNITEQSNNFEEMCKQERRTSPMRPALFGDMDRSRHALPMLSRLSPLRASLERAKKISGGNANSSPNITDQFLEKIEHLTDMQKEADELRQQMEATERITARQKQDVEYLRQEYEKLKLADPKLAHHIEAEIQDKKSEVAQNHKLYQTLSTRLDHLSAAIEKSMNDIQSIEEQLTEENHIFTEKMKHDIDSALKQLSLSIPNTVTSEQKKWIDAYRQAENDKVYLEQTSVNQIEEIDHLKKELNKLAEENERIRRSKPFDGEVLVLRQDLDRLKEDALVAKDDLESEIETEKVRNDELQNRIEEMQSNEYELQEQLELVSDRYRQILDKVNTDNYHLQDTINRHASSIHEEFLQRIKIATSDPSAITKSTDPIDMVIGDLVKSVEQSSLERNRTLSPVIGRINDDVQRIKDQLEEMDRNIKSESKNNKVTSDDHVTKKPKTINKNSKRKPDKKPRHDKLVEACEEYRDEMSDVKTQIENLEDVIRHFREHRQQKKIPKKSKERMSFSRRRSEEVSDEEPSDEGYTPRFKSRAHSQDRIRKTKPKNSFSDFRKWKSVQQDVSADDELLDEIENELGELKQQVSSAGSRSTQKFDDAMNYINDLEMEIQARDEELAIRDKKLSDDRNKRILNENLHQTMSQVEQCQQDIHNLHRRLNIKGTVTDGINTNGNELDINKIRLALQAQKAEIERLNSLLERLTIHGNPSTTYSSTPQFPQIPVLISDNRTSQMFTAPPQVPFNSQSTPILHAGTNVPMVADGHLFCNVPEHHHLEDYLNIHSGKHSSMKIKSQIKSETHRCMDTLDMLRRDINKKNEELDDVEIQVSKQTGEIERLNYQINQLNLTKQDLIHQLSSLRQETDHATRETIATTSESIGQMRAKKSQLNEDINKLELNLSSRRDEMCHLESELHACRNQLSQVQSDTSDTVRRYEEARCSHRQLLLECEQLEKRSNEASLELANGMHDLNQVQNEISGLVSKRSNLDGILSKTQEIMAQKDLEFQRITESICTATKRLNNLQSDLTMMNEQNREKMHMISDGDQLLTDTRMELNHLKKEIELNQLNLERMESDIGEKTVAIEIANGELERLRQSHQRSAQDHVTEQARSKRDIMELKSSISEGQVQRSDLLSDIEGLKIKNAQLKENIERQEQTLHAHVSEVDRRAWEMQHSENMLKMKQGQLQKLSSEYNERLADVERLQEEVHQQEIEFKRIDTDIKRKTLEIEKIRQTIAMEHENQQRLEFDKENLGTSVATLTKERTMLQSQIKELENDVKNLKKQESQSHESVLSLETRLSQARMDYEKMCSDKATETIKRDELKLQTNNMTKQLHESKCELQSMRERLTMLDGQCDERTTEVRKKMQTQNNLNIEIRKLQDQIRMVNMSFDEANSQEHQKKDRLSSLDVEISRKDDELKNLERKKEDLKNQITKQESKLEKVIKNSSSELNHLKSELSEKLDNLEATGSRLHQIRKDAAIKEFTEQKICELEQIIRQHEGTIDFYEQENRRISNHVSVLSRDIASLREAHQFEMESKDKDISKLRKKFAREVFQLEKLAEDQCQRANSLSEDLSQARRDYMLLRNRILIYGRLLNVESTCLAQEHFIEQQNLFKEYLQPTHYKADLSQSMDTTMMTEHRRHLQNQLNLLRDNIESAAHTTTTVNGHDPHHSYLFNKSLDGDRKWYTTSSSGLGSTLEHNASDTSPENERVKKVLHDQFNDEIDMMHSENAKSQNMCRQLRSDINNFKASLPTDKSTSVSAD